MIGCSSALCNTETKSFMLKKILRLFSLSMFLIVKVFTLLQKEDAHSAIAEFTTNGMTKIITTTLYH